MDLGFTGLGFMGLAFMDLAFEKPGLKERDWLFQLKP